MFSSRVFRIAISTPAVAIALALSLDGCSSMRSALGINETDRAKPIANPFQGPPNGHGSLTQNMILRTKKGDRSVELEIPGDPEHLTDFTIPVNTSSKDGLSRSPASAEGLRGEDSLLDESYKNHLPSVSDREITHGLPHGFPEDDTKRQDIEKGLNLAPSEDPAAMENPQSYLATVDHIKQLYKSTRFEAALLETDEAVRLYPTDPKLYEMRGTLLDHLGQKDLALRSWNQALRFNPSNETLRKFIYRKQLRSTGGSP